MKNRKQLNRTAKSQISPPLPKQAAIKRRRFRHAKKALKNPPCPPTGIRSNWYQERKRAQQRLRAISEGNIIIFENGYRGHHVRHWLKNLSCGHVFRATLREVALIGHNAICPFCNHPSDMRQFGSVRAIQEHVHALSLGNLEFMEGNDLREVDDYYEMACTIHGHRFEQSFVKFLSDPMGSCSICAFEKD